MVDIGQYRDSATVIGVLIASLSLAVTAFANFFNYRTNRAKLWLDVRTAFGRHDEVHSKLRVGGDWFGSDTHPSSPRELADVEAYMGLLEYCEIMMSDRLIDEGTFKRLFSYRLDNLLANRKIFARISDQSEYWTDFLKLCARMEIDLNRHGAACDDRMQTNSEEKAQE